MMGMFAIHFGVEMQIVTRESLEQMLFTASPEKRAKIIGRAMVALFKRQTESERMSNTTDNLNNQGFSGSDARRGSITAKYFIKHGTLLEWMVEQWMKPQRNGCPRIVKYWKQLNEVAVAKAQTK